MQDFLFLSSGFFSNSVISSRGKMDFSQILLHQYTLGNFSGRDRENVIILVSSSMVAKTFHNCNQHVFLAKPDHTGIVISTSLWLVHSVYICIGFGHLVLMIPTNGHVCTHLCIFCCLFQGHFGYFYRCVIICMIKNYS